MLSHLGKLISSPGDRKGVWSLTVTRNWRLAFRIEDDEKLDVDYEDYH
jgi:proteic killer suppression protein